MKETIKSLIDEVITMVEKDIETDDAVLAKVLYAYNKYQENERDGVDYIFNINNKEDLKCCVDGGLTARDITDMFLKSGCSDSLTPYFYFGANHPKPEQIRSKDDLIQQMVGALPALIPFVIAYPHTCTLYDMCITCFMEENNML